MLPVKRKLLLEKSRNLAVVIVIGLLFAASVWVTAAMIIDRDYQTTVENIHRENSNLAKAFEEHVRRSLITADNKLKLIKEEYEREGALTPAVRALLRPETFDLSVSQSGIMDSRGNIIALMRETSSAPSNASDREFFKRHRESPNPGLIIDKPLRGITTGKWSIIMTRRINNPDGSFNGVVSVALLADYFGAFYRQMELGEGKLVVLVGTDGIIRARQVNENLMAGSDVIKSELYQHAMRQSSGSVLATSTTDGQERFISYRVLPDYPLYIAVGVLKDQALAAHKQRRSGYNAIAILFIMTIGVALDIISRQRERELVALKKVGQMERMASLGTLAAGVSHEINQPLQALKVTADGMAYLLKQGKTIDPEKLLENCERISRSTDRISSIVKRLRDFVNRSKSDSMTVVNLNEVERHAIDLLRQRLQSHSISLHEHLSAEPPLIWGNGTRLEEVFINIIVNATQALETVDRTDKVIMITTACQGSKVLLEIYNNGPRIPQDIIDQIFAPFFSSRINNENMGLGLSIIHTIIQDHEGQILAFNHHASKNEGLVPVFYHDEGVSFRVELPRYLG